MRPWTYCHLQSYRNRSLVHHYSKDLPFCRLEDSHRLKYNYTCESRIGYRHLLGGTRHFGYYHEGQWWPFPIGKASRAMEEKMYQVMDLEDATVLDGGAGNGM